MVCLYLDIHRSVAAAQKKGRPKATLSILGLHKLFNNNLPNVNLVAADDSYEVSTSM